MFDLMLRCLQAEMYNTFCEPHTKSRIGLHKAAIYVTLLSYQHKKPNMQKGGKTRLCGSMNAHMIFVNDAYR